MSEQYFGIVCHLGKIRITITARQTGHAPSIAHASQNRACRHGNSAKSARGATRHTSLQSSEVVAAAAVAVSDTPEVVAAGMGACLSSFSSSLLLLLLSSRSCRDSVWALTEWHAETVSAVVKSWNRDAYRSACSFQPCSNTTVLSGAALSGLAFSVAPWRWGHMLEVGTVIR